MVEVAFYKAKKGKFADKLMAWLQDSKHSHVELVADNFCYSSSYRDGGVRQKVINLADGKWEVFEMPDAKMTHKAVQFFNQTKDDGYSLTEALFNLVVKLLVRTDFDRWTCVEWVTAALSRALGSQLDGIVTMNNLYDYCKKYGDNDGA